jgi:hypothetical protein
MSLIAELEKWTEERKAALINSYNQEGLKASGNWERELESEVKQEGSKIYVRINGTKYTEQLIRGRRATSTMTAGNPTLQEVIRQWIDDKGIQPNGNISKDSLSWAISKKIHRDGIKVPNRFNSGTFIDKVFYTTDGTLTQFRNILNRHYSTTIKQEITQGL